MSQLYAEIRTTERLLHLACGFRAPLPVPHEMQVSWVWRGVSLALFHGPESALVRDRISRLKLADLLDTSSYLSYKICFVENLGAAWNPSSIAPCEDRSAALLAQASARGHTWACGGRQACCRASGGLAELAQLRTLSEHRVCRRCYAGTRR